MYVIFYNNKPIYLTDNQSNCNDDKYYDIDKKPVLELLNEIDSGKINSACIVNTDLNYLHKKFTANFKVTEAAGGLVFNGSDALLFIFRNGVWDLPKGKVEKNETVEKAALREVEEECGVTDLSLGCFLDKTYHIYEYKNKLIFKITHWYKMTSSQNTALVPQIEEGITKTVFLDKKAQIEALKNTYPNIKLLVENFKERQSE